MYIFRSIEWLYSHRLMIHNHIHSITYTCSYAVASLRSHELWLISHIYIIMHNDPTLCMCNTKHDTSISCNSYCSSPSVCSLLQFQQLCDETYSWINEKDQTLSTDDCGRDLPSVQALQRKHMVCTYSGIIIVCYTTTFIGVQS